MQIIVNPDFVGKPAIGYIRFSTREQEVHTDGIERDKKRLTAAGADIIFYETGSRSKSDRKYLQMIIGMIQSRECSKVLFTRLDRVTDSNVLLEKLIEICLDAGEEVHIVSLDDAIDFTSVGGRLMARILVNFARAEVERTSDRVRHGWANLRSKNKAVNPPFGYLVKGDRYVLDQRPYLCLLETQTTLTATDIAHEYIQAFLSKKSLRLALRLINEKYGVRNFAHNNTPGEAMGGAIAPRKLGFSTGGFANYLKNPVLRGHTVFLRAHKSRATQITRDTHEALMSESESQEIEQITQHNRQYRGFTHTRLKYPLSGLVFCSECRGSCYSMAAGRGRTKLGYNYYFQCKGWKTRSCSQKKMARMDAIEQAVDAALTRRHEAIAAMTERSLSPRTEEPQELKKLRADLQYFLDSPQRALAEPAIAALQAQILQAENLTEHRQAEISESSKLLEKAFSDRGYWRSLKTDEKRQIYHALIERVVILNGEVQAVDLRI